MLSREEFKNKLHTKSVRQTGLPEVCLPFFLIKTHCFEMNGFLVDLRRLCFLNMPAQTHAGLSVAEIKQLQLLERGLQGLQSGPATDVTPEKGTYGEHLLPSRWR
jgi:hypothetical protein